MNDREVLSWIDEVELDDTDADFAAVVYWELERGVQPVIWPMRLHVHTQECMRA